MESRKSRDNPTVHYFHWRLAEKENRPRATAFSDVNSDA